LGRCCTDHFANTALPEEQLGQHEILRVPSGLRAHPQNDNASFEGGEAPFTPFSEYEHSILNKVLLISHYHGN
jgi:hypothetical protein